MKSKKPINHTNETLKLPKTLTPMQTIEDLMGWKTARINDGIIDNLCDFLLQWSLQEDAIYIVSGLKKFGIPRFKFYEWLPRSEKLREVHSVIKDNIGDNLFRLGMFRKIETGMAQRILPQFCQEFDIALKQEQDFKKELANIKKDALKDVIENLTLVERDVKTTKQVDEVVKKKRKRE